MLCFKVELALAFALPVLRAAIVPTTHEFHGDDHVDQVPNSFSGNWYQEPNHPVYSLFRRDDDTPYPAVGTPGALFFFFLILRLS